MKSDRKFLRQCASCRQYKEKTELIRITRDYKTGEALINENNLLQGRSLYVCRNLECIEKLLKNKKGLYKLKAEMSRNIKSMLYTVLKK